MAKPLAGPDPAEIADHYDRVMYSPIYAEYHAQSDFGNFGWWDATTTDQRQACENLMERLLAFIPEKTGRILDVACGKGATTRYLAKYYRADQVTGINISDRQLQTCRGNAPGCAFVRMDAARLGFRAGVFESILCVEAAFHFDTREMFLREAHRVLKPGGQLVLTDMLMRLEAERRRPLRTERNYVSDPAEYRAVCQRAGFGEVEVIDATEQCWKGCYRHVVRFAHEKYLARQIDFANLGSSLESVYGHVPDVTYYLVAVARKR